MTAFEPYIWAQIIAALYLDREMSEGLLLQALV
jgi:hypothetical protein